MSAAVESFVGWKDQRVAGAPPARLILGQDAARQEVVDVPQRRVAIGKRLALRRKLISNTVRMLARYQVVRGKRPPDNPLPEGRRIDTRKHTRHCLRPQKSQVAAFIRAPSRAGFTRFAAAYRATIERRFARDPRPFEALAALATGVDVFIGCNCPTGFNPNVKHCHTTLALAFMKRKYPRLQVVMP